MKDYLHDIEALTFNLKGDLKPEDFIEEANKAIQIIQKKIFEANDKIISSVEKLKDSFGGEECTLRDLKGE